MGKVTYKETKANGFPVYKIYNDGVHVGTAFAQLDGTYTFESESDPVHNDGVFPHLKAILDRAAKIKTFEHKLKKAGIPSPKLPPEWD